MLRLETEGCRFAAAAGIHHGSSSRRAWRRMQCSAARADSSEEDGDLKVQQQLVEMIHMQVTKVNLSEFLDDRSDYLRTIALDFRSDHARIALRAMIGIDDAGNRVLRELDAGASAIEKELKLARADIEAQSEDAVRYHALSVKARNERLFFKGLYSEPETFPPLTKTKISPVVASESADSSAGYKQFLSGSIALVLTSLVYSSGSAFVTGTMMKSWKIASYGVILTLLLTQLAYADTLFSEGKVPTAREEDEALKKNQ